MVAVRKSILSNLLMVFVLSSMLSLLACPSNQLENKDSISISKEEAVSRARERLLIEIIDHELEVYESVVVGDNWKIIFVPVSKDLLGRGVTVKINAKDGKVARVIRSQ